MSPEFFIFWLFVIPVLLLGVGKLVGRLLSACGHTGKCIEDYWNQRPHFVQNLFVGAVIALVIHVSHGLSLAQEMEDWAMDTVNRLQVDTRWLNSADQVGYTFLEID